MEVEEGMLSSRNAIFCLQPKGGKRECYRKCQGASPPLSFPGVVSPPGLWWKGRHTHPLRICPLHSHSSQLGTFLQRTARMCTIDINLRVVSVKVSCGSGRIAAGGTFSDDVLGHFCFTRQNTLQGSCLWDVYEASCTKLLIQSHTVVIVYVGFV